MRIGHGYDVHALAEHRDLIIGGVKIPYELGLLGHSDADVLAHAVSDALLGAAAKSGVLGFTAEELCRAIDEKIPERFRALNKKAIALSGNI